jgi:glucose-1-phosphate thymidylyltransferase
LLGLLLSGGTGSRLRPLTYSQQKQLIPVANKPILFFGLEDMISAGIRDIGVIVGPNADQVEAVVRSRRWDANITFIKQDAPLGIAHAIKTASIFLGSSPFAVYLGDNILRNGISEHVAAFIESGNDASILLTKADHPERFGVAELDGEGRVQRLIEKPKEPPTDLALVGVYLFSSPIMKAISSIGPSWRGELEITDAIQWLIDHGYKVRASCVQGWWKDTGRPEDILAANRLVLDDLPSSQIESSAILSSDAAVYDRVRVGSGTVLDRGSIVRGPAVVGSGCRITSSCIGPYTSIGNNCEIKNATVEGSIVMDGSRIELNQRIVDSLIGANVRITSSRGKASGYSLVLGDSSELHL